MFLKLLKKDFYCWSRSKALLVSLLAFSFVLVVVASFAFRQVGYGELELRSTTPGILWLLFFFVGVVSLNHSLLFEQRLGALTGMIFTSIDPSKIFLSKCVANWISLWVLFVLITLMHALLYGARIGDEIWFLFAIEGIVSIGFVSVGTLLSSISVVTRGREILLPVLLFPLLLPLLSAAVFLTRTVLLENMLDTESFWFVLILAYDVIAVVLGWVLFPYILVD